MKSETSASLALLALYERNDDYQVGYRSDVVQVLLDLEDEGISSLGVRFRATPDGVGSEELSRFIGRLAMSGYLVQESPIRLNEHAVELLQRHVVTKLKSPDVAAAVEFLKLHLPSQAPAAAVP